MDCNFEKPPVVRDDESNHAFKPIAEKASFVVLECFPGADGEIAKRSVRRKMKRQRHTILDRIKTLSHEAHSRRIDGISVLFVQTLLDQGDRSSYSTI